MGRLKRSVDINASGEEVFELLLDLDRLPQWSTITTQTHGTPRQLIEQGDTFVQTPCVFGQSHEAQWRVTELSRPGRTGEERELEHSLHDLEDLAEAGSGR